MQLHSVHSVQHSPADLRSLGPAINEIHRLHQAYQHPHWTAFDSPSMMASTFSKASLASSAAATANSVTSSTTAEVATATSSTAVAAASSITFATSFVSEASSARIVGCVTLGALLPLHPMTKWNGGGGGQVAMQNT